LSRISQRDLDTLGAERQLPVATPDDLEAGEQAARVGVVVDVRADRRRAR
jgi:hypothetical protein